MRFLDNEKYIVLENVTKMLRNTPVITIENNKLFLIVNKEYLPIILREIIQISKNQKIKSIKNFIQKKQIDLSFVVQNDLFNKTIFELQELIRSSLFVVIKKSSNEYIYDIILHS